MNHIALYLKEIFFQKKTGKLTFKEGDTARYIFFQDGEIIQVKTTVPEERLGEILFKLHRIEGAEHSRIDDFIEPNKSLGEVLKNKGVISEKDLEEALVYQVRESVLNCFLSFTADISFLEHEKFSDKAGQSRVNVPFLIEYGIRRLNTVEPFRAFISARQPARKSDTYAYILTKEEKDILDLIDGRETAQSLFKKSKAYEDFFWRSMFLFYCLDMIDVPGDEKAASPESEQRPAADMVPGGDADIEEALAFREGLPGKNYYQVLGLSRTATTEEIKKVYFQLARRFHPDRFPRGLSMEKRAMVEAVFSAVTGAYRILSNTETRREYDSQGPTETAGSDSQDFIRIAEIKFRKGKTLYNQGRFQESMTFLAEAVRLRKDKGDYFLLLAMAESKVPGYSLKAEEDFSKAIDLEPWNPEGYVGLGMLYKNEGLKIKAGNQFKKAIEADPEHQLARQQYAEVTGAKKKGRSDFFSFSLFGSGKKKKK